MPLYARLFGVLSILCATTMQVHGITCHLITSTGHAKMSTAEDASKHLKLTAGLLNYPTCRGIPVERVDTHSLRGGGRERACIIWVLGHRDSKNGTMEGFQVQGVHSGGASKLYRCHVHGYENKIQLHEHCWLCVQGYNRNCTDDVVQRRIQCQCSGIDHFGTQQF